MSRQPWDDYVRMSANDVILRLAVASREELATVAQYERFHRGRENILAAAERHLRRAMIDAARADVRAANNQLRAGDDDGRSRGGHAHPA